MFPAHHLTPNYQAFQHNPDLFAAALPFVIGDHARSLVATRSTYIPVRLNLSLVAPLLDRAADTAADIISANKARLPHHTDDAYLDSRGHALGDTYTRGLDLYDECILSAIETTLASAILKRVRLKAAWPDAANARGLALLDIHLCEAARAIKPLLARQTSLAMQ